MDKAHLIFSQEKESISDELDGLRLNWREMRQKKEILSKLKQGGVLIWFGIPSNTIVHYRWLV